ncbi:MAG: hypothetical protein KJ947_07880, partial [Alphaproteobacteria bacterium]|nr:hypothetical protein [Alphaproteobacteria bacterium]
TLSTLDTEDHRSMPVPSSTSLLWMLNQLRLSQSPHNRFIDHKTCSRAAALSQFSSSPLAANQSDTVGGMRLASGPLALKTDLVLCVGILSFSC